MTIIVGVFVFPIFVPNLDRNYSASHSLVIGGCSLGIWLILSGYRLCVRTFEPGKHSDARPPILYLRGFESDGRRSLQPKDGLALLHGIDPNWDQKKSQVDSWNLVEKKGVILAFNPIRVLRMFFNIGVDSVAEVLARGFGGLGPLVAIGRPGDSLAIPGADQMFVSDEGWKQVVLDYISSSQAVILQPSGSAGVMWEVDQVMYHVPHHRVLICMLEFHGKPFEYSVFQDRTREHHGVILPDSVPTRKHPCFVYFETDGTVRLQDLCLQSPILWPFTGNAIDIPRTFWSFIQGLAGGPRDSPRELTLNQAKVSHFCLEFF